MNFDTGVLQVAIEDIIPNRFQPRLAFDDASLNELASSIKQHGIIQPLVLRKIGDKYEIVAGERRYKAAMLAGLSSVPAVVAKIDDKKSAEVAIAENVQRRELTAIEEARSYRALLDQGYMSEEQLARKMGVSVISIENKLKLLNLANEVQDAVLENKISERHARALLSVSDSSEQVKWLNKIINERLTVRQLDELLKKGVVMNQNMNLETQIQSTMDVPTITPSLELGPIDLGVQTQLNKAGDLESEAVNMQMTENNPFDNHISPSIMPNNIGSVPAIEETIPLEKKESTFIDSLDSLDVTPPLNNFDINEVRSKISSLVDNLKQLNYKIDVQENNEMGQTTFAIIIKHD